jgi:hypothetical protein
MCHDIEAEKVEVDNEPIPAKRSQPESLKSVKVESSSENMIAQFNEDVGTFLTPNGQYSIELYDSFFRMRGSNSQNFYKIKYKYISRFFLLPSPDNIHMIFVIALDRPIQDEGFHRHQMLVWETTKESSELEIHLDPQVLTTEYQDSLQPVMQGSLCNLIAKTFKVIADKKVFMPGNFANACVKCAYKANEGHLYPLEKSFVFIHKPPLMIRFEEIESVEFQRYHNASVQHGSSTRNFDLCITPHPTMGGSSSVLADGVKEYVFSGIDQSDYPGLYNFLSGKTIQIRNQNWKESSDGGGKASAMKQASDTVELPSTTMEQTSKETGICQRNESSSSGLFKSLLIPEKTLSLKLNNISNDGQGKAPMMEVAASKDSPPNGKVPVTGQTKGKRKHRMLSEASSSDGVNRVSSDQLNDLNRFYSTVDSLEDILPIHEAIFLGEKLWIFTIQQLATVVDHDLPSHDGSDIAVRRSAAVEEFENALIQEYRDEVTVTDVVRRWRDAIMEWKQWKHKKAPSSSKFSFTGPVSCLTSPFLIDFLSRNKIYSAFEFLAIKKTENSSHSQALSQWRKQHGFESKLQYR